MILIPILLRALVLGILATPFVAEASAGRVDSILETRNLDELGRAIVDSNNAEVQRRACEIQRREGLAPTACYGALVGLKDRAHHIRDLDRECLQRAVSANRVPAVDEFTSTPCREAIEARSLDLAYAGRRDALRYP